MWDQSRASAHYHETNSPSSCLSKNSASNPSIRQDETSCHCFRLAFDSVNTHKVRRIETNISAVKIQRNRLKHTHITLLFQLIDPPLDPSNGVYLRHGLISVVERSPKHQFIYRRKEWSDDVGYVINRNRGKHETWNEVMLSCCCVIESIKLPLYNLVITKYTDR